ncbi:MAG TPA: IS30 family transposase [Nocardioidaceae bacterium]|nr:IS30 family transposase [Nocardioidaceae bacterium]
MRVEVLFMAGKPGPLREVQRVFWAVVVAGGTTEAAAVAAGVSRRTGCYWFRQAGGMSPVGVSEPVGRYLCVAEREEIAIGRARGLGVREIARGLGRAPSTVSRELRRNARARRPRVYRAHAAQARADGVARRPKVTKLESNPVLGRWVSQGLQRRWSPQQIAARLVAEYPDDERMRVSHETIYKALYVQGRGGLRRELSRCLRTGRALRRPRGRTDRRREHLREKVMISQRPAEVADRAVPGHWEGDLIVGKNSRSAIGTLVERSTRFTMLLHLPHAHGAEQVRDAMLTQIARLPAHLRRSLTWDQGVEMALHRQIAAATDMAIYFCDPASPWQRGSNENTNGLLRQYFPKGTDLSVHPAHTLDLVAAELNGRPRKTLSWRTPGEALHDLLTKPE